MENKASINPDCFLCRKNFNNDSSDKIFNLRQLFRYLKMKLKLDQNSVLLSCECSKLGLQLYEKIVELGITKIKINYSLEQLVTKISTDSGNDTNALKKLV